MSFSEQSIVQLVQQFLGAEMTALERAERGQISETWFFRAAGKAHVLRFAPPRLGVMLRKDRYVTEQLLQPGIPVATFNCVDRFEDRTFAITERVEGDMLDSLQGEDLDAIMPSVIRMLDTIHQTPVPDAQGYGGFNDVGVGRAKSWQEFLLAVGRSDPGGFYGDWHHLFDDTFLERDIFDDLYRRMQTLFPYLPEERYLVHGDYGFDNMIVADGEIRAVLDWANASFGDFLWDVAWLGLCMPQRDIVSEIRAYYRDTDRSVDNIDERLRCYYCYIGLDTLRFYAARAQPEAYDWMKSRLASMLE